MCFSDGHILNSDYDIFDYITSQQFDYAILHERTSVNDMVCMHLLQRPRLYEEMFHIF